MKRTDTDVPLPIENRMGMLTAWAAARRFMSKPMVQTEVRRSMTKVTTAACSVPMKQTSVVSDRCAGYCLMVCVCRMKSAAQARVAMMTNSEPRNHSLPPMAAAAAAGASAPPAWAGSACLVHASSMSGPL